MRLDTIKTENLHRVSRRVEQCEKEIRLLRESLDALNPKAILKRGYGAVLDGNGTFVRTAGQIKNGDSLTIALSDGEIDCIAEEVRRGSR